MKNSNVVDLVARRNVRAPKRIRCLTVLLDEPATPALTEQTATRTRGAVVKLIGPRSAGQRTPETTHD